MKIISYNEEKRIIILEKRGIDLHIIANLIGEWEIIDKRINPGREWQMMYVILYQWYYCAVPFVETDREIFIKTAYLSRKLKKLYS